MPEQIKLYETLNTQSVTYLTAKYTGVGYKYSRVRKKVRRSTHNGQSNDAEKISIVSVFRSVKSIQQLRVGCPGEGETYCVSYVEAQKDRRKTMYSGYGQERLAKIHQWELRREAEHQRQAAMIAPHRNVALLAVNKLGVLLRDLRIGRKQVALRPKPVTGSL